MSYIFKINSPILENNKAIFFSVLIAVIFTIESWILGPFSWIYGYGSGLETIPALKALSFNDRNLSLWSPFIAGGIDRLAFWGNANPFGPEFFLFKNLPVWLANGFHRFLQYLIAAFFTIKIAQEQLRLNSRWSILMAAFFCSFSYFTVGAMFTLPGVPFLLWALDFSTKGNRKYIKAFLSAILFSFATTFTFGIPYLFIFSFLWLSLITKVNLKQALVPLLIFWITLTVATSPQIIAMAYMGAYSHRANWELEAINFSLDGIFYRQLQFDLFSQNKSLEFFTMNFPFWIFIIGFPIALIYRKKYPLQRFSVNIYLYITFIFLLISQKWLWILLQKFSTLIVPFAKGIYMGRFFQIPAPFLIASGSILVFYYLYQLFSKDKIAKFAIKGSICCLLIYLIVTPKVHLFYDLGVNDWGQKNYEIKALDEIKKSSDLFRVASVLPLQPAYAYAQGLETVDGWANLYPSVYRDLWLQVLTPLLNANPINKQIFGVETGKAEDNFIFLGSDLVQKNLGLLPGEDLDESLKNGFDLNKRFNLNILRLLNVKYLLSNFPLRGDGLELVHAKDPWPTWPEYRSRNTGLVEGIRKPPGTVAPSNLSFLQPFLDLYDSILEKNTGKDIFIYALTPSLNRFRFVESLFFTETDKEALKAIASMGFEQLQRQAVVTKSDLINLPTKNKFNIGKIIIKEYKPDLILLEYQSDDTSFMVIANTWNPFWIAEIDNTTSTLIKVNYAQFGLLLPKGNHQIRLRYCPPYSYLNFTSRQCHK